MNNIRTIQHGNDTYRVVDQIPANYHIWNIGVANAPEGYIPLCRPDPAKPNTPYIDADNLLAVAVPDEHDRKLIMDAVSSGFHDITAVRNMAAKENKFSAGDYDSVRWQRATDALPAMERLPWDETRAKPSV